MKAAMTAMIINNNVIVGRGHVCGTRRKTNKEKTIGYSYAIVR